MPSIQREQTLALVQETHKMLSSGSGSLMETYGILEQTWDQSTQNEVIWFVLVGWEILSLMLDLNENQTIICLRLIILLYILSSQNETRAEIPIYCVVLF